MLLVAWGRKVRMMAVARCASSCSRSPSGKYASVASAHAVLLSACACGCIQQGFQSCRRKSMSFNRRRESAAARAAATRP